MGVTAQVASSHARPSGPAIAWARVAFLLRDDPPGAVRSQPLPRSTAHSGNRRVRENRPANPGPFSGGFFGATDGLGAEPGAVACGGAIGGASGAATSYQTGRCRLCERISARKTRKYRALIYLSWVLSGAVIIFGVVVVLALRPDRRPTGYLMIGVGAAVLLVWVFLWPYRKRHGQI
jgi:hypothetical protein